jgi:DNA-binding NarL/FixJ family response regulator
VPEDVDAVVVAPSPTGDPFALRRDERGEVLEPLTSREREVLALLAEGLPNKAIAGALGISDQTVKFHVAAIIGKLGAANRTDAVRRAVRRGLVAL